MDLFRISNLFSENCTFIFVPVLDKSIVYPKAQDLWSQVPITLVILITRYAVVKYCFMPLGRWLKISDAKRKPVPHNEVLEEAYNKSTKLKNLSSIAKKVDMTERQVERWWRLRRSQDKPSTLVKFTGYLWMGSFFLYNFAFGIYVMWDKELFWDKIKSANLGITSDMWWYYTISSAFYWSLTLTQFCDVQRKDFWQMFVHHIATIALLSFGWIANLHGIGSLVLLLHDSSEIVLEFGKAANCARLGGITCLFVLFAATWIISRLILFPYWVLTAITVQAYVCNSPVLHLLNGLLWFLLVLHIFWTYTIFQIAYNTAISRKEPRDIRSCSSEEELDPKPKTLTMYVYNKDKQL